VGGFGRRREVRAEGRLSVSRHRRARGRKAKGGAELNVGEKKTSRRLKIGRSPDAERNSRAKEKKRNEREKRGNER